MTETWRDVAHTRTAGPTVARRWRSWHRWTPLVAGLCLFLVVIPGLFAPFVVGRLTIATWMLTFAAVGWALVREARTRGEASR